METSSVDNELVYEWCDNLDLVYIYIYGLTVSYNAVVNVHTFCITKVISMHIYIRIENGLMST